jgi:acetyltransferase
VRVCFSDYDREIALVAERLDPETEKLQIAGIGRLIRLRDSLDAEFSLIVADDYQGHGLGTEMVRRLIEVGREEGLERLVAEILGANGGMVRICEELGFTITADDDGETVQAELAL